MKLLFSITYYSPYISGLTLYVKRLAGELSKRKYQITVLTNKYSPELSGDKKIDEVRVVRANPLIKISKGFLSIDFIIKSFTEVRMADVLFLNLPQFEGVIPAIFGKIFGKRVIVIYHCEVILPPGILNYFIEKCLNLSNLLSLLMANTIITYTEDFADKSRILPNFGKKVQTVYPPIHKQVINNRVQNIIRQKIGRKSGFVIGVAARLSAEKGIEYLFQAIPFLQTTLGDKFRICVAGSLDPVGEKSYKEKILKLVEKYKEYVVFLGELKEIEMGSFYSLIDVLVLPSINSTESFGMVQAEAMLSGIPVVASDLPGVRVPVGKTGMGIIVPVKDPEKLADAIIEISKNREKYLKDQSVIKNEFLMDKTIGFYENLIKGSS